MSRLAPSSECDLGQVTSPPHDVKSPLFLRFLVEQLPKNSKHYRRTSYRTPSSILLELQELQAATRAEKRIDDGKWPDLSCGAKKMEQVNLDARKNTCTHMTHACLWGYARSFAISWSGILDPSRHTQCLGQCEHFCGSTQTCEGLVVSAGQEECPPKELFHTSSTV